MALFKASLLVLVFTLAIQGSEGLSCFECAYKEGDTDLSCLTGNPLHSVLVPGTPSKGMQFVCTVELKTVEGQRFVNRTHMEIPEGTDPNSITTAGPIEYTENPGENYIRFYACQSDNCNQQDYEDPPLFPPASDIQCYDCQSYSSNCETTPNNLINVSRIPFTVFPGSKPLQKISSSNEPRYTSEPIGEFGWVAYCDTIWRYNADGNKRIWIRALSWYHKDYHGDKDGICEKVNAMEQCFCKRDGCNGYVQKGLQCHDCEYSSSFNKDCETSPSKLKLHPDDWVTPGTKYVCTLEARYSNGQLSVTRSSQLVKDTEDSNQCIAGPTEGGQNTNPETNYIKLCSCATNRCNGNTTFDKPPKLPSPLKCYECRLSQDPGCNVPDSKYLKDIPAVPDFLSSWSADESAVAARRSEQVNELTPSKPIGKYNNVVYCETWYSKVLKGIGSRRAKYNYEPEPGKGGLDGKCVQDENYPDWRYCYCKTDGCNNESTSGVLGLAITGLLLVIGILSSWSLM